MPSASQTDLLLRFREAAAIEHRLLGLETWLLTEIPANAKDQDYHWRIATVRALTLIIHNRQLKPYSEDILRYLRGAFESKLGAIR
jgi:hypothetical protein